MASPHHVVVSGASGPTHLVYVASYLRHLSLPLTVSFVRHQDRLGRASLSDEQLRQAAPAAANVLLPENADALALSSEGRLTYVAVGAPGLRVWAALRRRFPMRRIPVVVTDEGLGTYGSWSTRRDAWRREQMREPWLSVRTSVVVAGDHLLTTRRWATYEHSRIGWKVNPDVAAEFQARLGGHVSPEAGRHVVMLTQPWVELGVLGPQEYADFIGGVRDAVLARDHTFAVHLHPAENSDRYAAMPGVHVMPAHPVELEAEVVSAAAVLGGPSTGLLNVAALYDVPAAWIRVPGLERLEAGLGRKQRSLLRHYLGAPTRAELALERLLPA